MKVATKVAISFWAWAVSLATVTLMLFMLCWIAIFGGYYAREPNLLILYIEILIELSGLIALIVVWYLR